MVMSDPASDTHPDTHIHTSIPVHIHIHTHSRESHTGNALFRKDHGPRYLMKEINEQHSLL